MSDVLKDFACERLKAFLPIILILLGLSTAPSAGAQQQDELKFQDVIGAVVAVHAEVPTTARTADHVWQCRATPHERAAALARFIFLIV